MLCALSCTVCAEIRLPLKRECSTGQGRAQGVIQVLLVRGQSGRAVGHRAERSRCPAVEGACARTESKETWNNDSVEVFLDYRNDQETVYNADDRRMVVDGFGRMHVVGLERHIQKAVKCFEGGYAVEITVSGLNMGGYDSFKGRVIGFDVACNDSDSAGKRNGRVLWRGTADNETDPSGFGTMLFPE